MGSPSTTTKQQNMLYCFQPYKCTLVFVWSTQHLFNFTQIWSFSTAFHKSPKDPIPRKSVQCGPYWYRQTDRQARRYGRANRHFFSSYPYTSTTDLDGLQRDNWTDTILRSPHSPTKWPEEDCETKYIQQSNWSNFLSTFCTFQINNNNN
jgi:hypothetical protein